MSKQRYVCVSERDRVIGSPKIRKGDIVTWVKTLYDKRGIAYYQFEEDNQDGYLAICFRPVDESFGEWVEATVLESVILEEA